MSLQANHHHSSNMVILLLFFAPLSSGSRREMTVEVSPNTEECFFTPITTLGPLVVEYMVMDSRGELGQYGELDINFRVMTPLAKTEHGSVASVLHSENKKGEGRHVFHPEAIGDYKACFENKFSYMNTKTVYFSIETEEAEEEDVVKDFFLEFEEQQYEEASEEIQQRLKRMSLELSTSLYLQNKMKATNTKDRILAEANFARVNTTSFFYLFLILSSGAFQTIVVKNLFEDPRKMHPMWRKLVAFL